MALTPETVIPLQGGSEGGGNVGDVGVDGRVIARSMFPMYKGRNFYRGTRAASTHPATLGM